MRWHFLQFQQALQGHSVAQNSLINLYEDGKAYSKTRLSLLILVFWLLQQGESAWFLGYVCGEGGPGDYKQAMYWYLKAAAQYVGACQHRFICINTGQALRKIIRLPLDWLRSPSRLWWRHCILWPLCITTEGRPVDLPTGSSTSSTVKFSHQNQRWQSGNSWDWRFTVEDKKQGPGISFIYILSLLLCEIELLQLK